MKWFLYRVKNFFIKFYHFISPFKDERLNLFIIFSLILVLIYIYRLFSLSLFEGEKWINLVKKQFQGSIKIASEKGKILDSNLTPLAVSERVVSFYVRPTEIKDFNLFTKIILRDENTLKIYAEKRKVSVKKLVELLSPLSYISLEDLKEAYQKRYTQLKNGRIPFVWLKKDVSCDLTKAYKGVSLALKIYYSLSGENRFEKRYPDLLGAVPEYKRKYPYSVASQVVGVTNRSGEGISGLEYLLEKKGIISGKEVVLEGKKDARGRVYLTGKEAVKFLTRKKGKNVVITIDGNLQYIFEKTLENYALKFKPRFINAVLMDANTGEILAAASYPFYHYGEKKKENFLELVNPRFITVPFEPGSVMKPIVFAAALSEKVINVNSIINCPASYKVADKVFHNEFHGKDVRIRAWEVIQYSDNVGIIQIAQRLGKEKLYKYLKLFGFGKKTGIELPGENGGFLKNWKKWRDVEFATISFGHFISTTTLQLAAAYAPLVNGGFYVKPKILKAIVDDKLNVIKTFPSEKKRIIPSEVSKIMRRVLTMVVEGGTGTATKLKNFYVGGKTGTALIYNPKIGRYDKTKISASFVGAFPMTNPKYVLAVTVYEPRVSKKMLWASKIAVPIFRDLAERVILYERVSPDRMRYTLLDNGTIVSHEINKNFLFTNGLAGKYK